jgi:hypothetical protein
MIALLIPFGAFIMVIIITWVASQEKQAKARYRAEVQKELIAKFGTGRELTEFLNSEGSRQLLGVISSAKEGSSQIDDPRKKTIDLITGGLICLSLGVAFFFVATGLRVFYIPAFIVGGVGVGLLLSAAISHHLSKKWGLDKPVTTDQLLNR